MGDDAAEKSRRQSLLLAFFLAALDVNVNVIWVVPLLLKGTALLPKATLVEAFCASQVLDKVSVQIAADLFDLDCSRPRTCFSPEFLET